MRKLGFIMAIFVSFAFGEKVTISDRIAYWEVKDDKNKVILNVKGNDKETMGKELVAGCIKYYKKKKSYRIGEEILYYVRYSSDNKLVALCIFRDFDKDLGIYNVVIRWDDEYRTWLFRAIENEQYKKLVIERDMDWR